MSVKYKTLVVNYAIATGNIDFPSMLVDGSNIMCTVNITALNAADATVALHQSIDETAWGLVPDSTTTLASGQSSHTWNVRGLVKGAYLRVSLTKGSATLGTVTDIKLLSGV
ncbi:MAG: hypothetical protein WCM93_10390 [Bacteroidota bacterium]